MGESAAIELPDPADDPEAYRETLLSVVGDEDPLEILAATVGCLRGLIVGCDPTTLEKRPAVGEWSAAEIVGHLLDDEIIFGFRLRLTLTAEQPSYPGNDPNRWAMLPKPPIEQLLSAFAALRAYNIWTLQSIPSSNLSRIGLHAEQGAETVEVNIRKTAAHDLAHLDQLKRCLTKLAPVASRKHDNKRIAAGLR